LDSKNWDANIWRQKLDVARSVGAQPDANSQELPKFDQKVGDELDRRSVNGRLIMISHDRWWRVGIWLRVQGDSLRLSHCVEIVKRTSSQILMIARILSSFFAAF